jgi:hypothetical protein
MTDTPSVPPRRPRATWAMVDEARAREQLTHTAMLTEHQRAETLSRTVNHLITEQAAQNERTAAAMKMLGETTTRYRRRLQSAAQSLMRIAAQEGLVPLDAYPVDLHTLLLHYTGIARHELAVIEADTAVEHQIAEQLKAAAASASPPTPAPEPTVPQPTDPKGVVDTPPELEDLANDLPDPFEDDDLFADDGLDAPDAAPIPDDLDPFAD